MRNSIKDILVILMIIGSLVIWHFAGVDWTAVVRNLLF